MHTSVLATSIHAMTPSLQLNFVQGVKCDNPVLLFFVSAL